MSVEPSVESSLADQCTHGAGDNSFTLQQVTWLTSRQTLIECRYTEMIKLLYVFCSSCYVGTIEHIQPFVLTGIYDSGDSYTDR